jgi:LPS sulfotransferase NodH
MRYMRLRTPSQSLNEALAQSFIRARSVRGRRDYQKFVIVGVARTGSTLLLSLLNAQPSVVAFGELFRGDGAIGWDIPPFLSRQAPRLLHKFQTRPLEFLNTEIFSAWPSEVAAVGFKLFYYHARSGAQAAVWDYLRNDPKLVVIHIKRLNVLEQYLSLRVAHATNVWSSSSPPVETLEPIRLDPEHCRRHFEEVRAQQTECDAFFAGQRIQTLTYEDLVANRAAAIQRVADHLGLRQLEAVEARIVRQRTRPVSAAIANYEELRDFFAGSEWEVYFGQPDTLLAGQQAA